MEGKDRSKTYSSDQNHAEMETSGAGHKNFQLKKPEVGHYEKTSISNVQNLKEFETHRNILTKAQ